MTDFNKYFRNIPRIANPLSVPQVTDRLLNRPLLVPALALFSSCIMTYVSGTLIPFCLILALFLISGIIAAVRKDLKLFFCLTMSMILMISGSLRLYDVLNSACPDSADGYYCGKIIYINRKLSGKSQITAEIQGIRCNVWFDSDIEEPILSSGAYFKASGQFKEPESAGNPGEFDYKKSMRSKGIRYSFYADSFTVTKVPEGITRAVLSFPDACFRIRESVFERFTYGRSSEEKGLLAAVCLGDSSLAEESVTREFSLSGCSHLLAVSGTHFSGFLLVLPYLLNAICPDRRKTTIIYVFFAFIVGCVTGWNESVVRSAFMSSSAFAGKDTVSAMSAAAVIMIIADPFCACRTGFLLSFSACIAIRILSPGISKRLRFLKNFKKLRSALSAQCAAIIGTMPFWGILNYRFGFIQFAVQAIGGLLAKLVCTMFVPGVFLSVIFPKEAAYVFSAPSCFFLELLRKTVGIASFASLSGSVSKPVEPLFIFSIWMFAFLKLIPPFSIRKVLIKLSCCLIAACFGIGVYSLIRPEKAEIVFADVGQGDCCLIIAGNTTCLIDGGTYEKGKKTVSELLDYYGIAKVDLAFMTHWDQDHAGGIAALNRTGRVGCVYTAFTGEDEDTEAFEKSLKTRECDPVQFRSILQETHGGDVFKLSENVLLKVIYPDRAVNGGNSDSLVLVIECCGTKFLLTGDIGTETEDKLISQGILEECDILKVAHHGSKYSSGVSFLSQTSPQIAVIQVGKHNLYGHPSPKTLANLDKAGSRVLRTDNDGAVIFEFC